MIVNHVKSLSSLEATVAHSLSTNRPLLHHLNADTTWLLQIPLSSTGNGNDAGTYFRGRSFFNILIDPWLDGSQSDVARWFSQQWHASPSAVPTIEKVEALCADAEAAVAETDSVLKYENSMGIGNIGSSMIDVIAISHEFTDHCHKQTLLKCDRSIIVIATKKAADLIRSWKHFHTVVETPAFPSTSSKGDWRDSTPDLLPVWLTISRVTTRNDAFYYHSALLIAWRGGADTAEACAVIYTPHGIHAGDLAPITRADPRINTLAVLHGLHDVSLWYGRQQLNLGAHNGLKAVRLVGAKYWIGTHDEIKTAGGLVGWFLRRKMISVDEALEREGKDDNDARYIELGNGETLVLS